MAKLTLLERLEEYENAQQLVLMRRVPVVISIDGKGFQKLTSNIHKPFSTTFCQVMSDTVQEVATKIQGATFAFTYSDKAFFILFNDQTDDTEPWLGNRLQDINSVTASLFTQIFIRKNEYCELNLNDIGDCVFKSRVFTLPNDVEVVNYLKGQQALCKKHAIEQSCIHYLSSKFNLSDINKMLYSKNLDERKELLKIHLDFDFDRETDIHLSRGIAIYRQKVVEEHEGEEITRRIWVADWQLPAFIKNQNFVEEKILI